ncbi:MAG: hypothetical protein QN834_10330, partial [Nitrososphaeraceae archaeon]|nr:hypothetical protein [Nitrososphaeraceae archaeon]
TFVCSSITHACWCEDSCCHSNPVDERTQTLLDAKILATLSALASTKKSSVKDLYRAFRAM